MRKVVNEYLIDKVYGRERSEVNIYKLDDVLINYVQLCVVTYFCQRMNPTCYKQSRDRKA